MAASTESPDVTPRADGSLPIKLLHDRVLVSPGTEDGERTSTGGILIPATAQVAKRLTWARVVAAGPTVRNIEVGDRVLFEPEDRSSVELQGAEYVMLRERDVHAVASSRHADGQTGLYL
jgi:chaperonin GroES